MMTKHTYRFVQFGIAVLLALVGLANPAYPQFHGSDSSFHPYHVNYWVTSGVIIAAAVAEKVGAPWIANKQTISQAEIQTLDRNDFTAIDRWALNFDPSNMNYYVDLSDKVLTGIIFLPVVTLLDHSIRQDWLDVLLMYLETMGISNNMYLYSPFGATFQNRLRPVVYYDALGDTDVRTRGANRNSFYSGHTASAAAASFFTAKVFCDYHPDLGWEKYLIYTAALVPPLVLSYYRLRSLAHFPSDLVVGIGVGALCGILIPEFHRIRSEKLSFGVYPAPEGLGISLTWKPDF